MPYSNIAWKLVQRPISDEMARLGYKRKGWSFSRPAGESISTVSFRFVARHGSYEVAAWIRYAALIPAVTRWCERQGRDRADEAHLGDFSLGYLDPRRPGWRTFERPA